MSDKAEKNRVVSADISIKLTGDEYQVGVTFNWLRGAKTELLPGTTFPTILEAGIAAVECIDDVLPDLEKRLADIGVDIQDPKHGDSIGLTEAKAGGETKKADVTSFHFAGEVGQMQCKCHKDQWAVFAFAIDPNGQRKLLNSKPVKDEQAGKDALEAFTMASATEFLKKFDLSPDEANKIQVLRGADALKAEANARAMIDKRLH